MNYGLILEEVSQREKGNHHSLIIYRTKGGWWRMMGNSALLFKYIISKKIGKKPKLTDERQVLIRDIVSLETKLNEVEIRRDEEMMAELGKEQREGMLIFKLRRDYLSAEIEELKNIDRERRARLRSVVTPKIVLPQVYLNILEVVKIMNRQKVPGDGAMKDHAKAVAREMEDLFAEYVVNCKDASGDLENLRGMITELSRMEAKVEVMAEVGAWGADACLEMAECLEIARKSLKAELG